MNRLLTLPLSKRLLALPLLAAAGLVPASAAGLVPASAAAASRPPAKPRSAAKTISAHPAGRMLASGFVGRSSEGPTRPGANGGSWRTSVTLI